MPNSPKELEKILKKLEEILNISDDESEKRLNDFKDFLTKRPLANLSRLFGINFFEDPWIRECANPKDRMSQEEIKILSDFQAKHKQELCTLLSQMFKKEELEEELEEQEKEKLEELEELEDLAKVMMLWQVLMSSILFAQKRDYSNQENTSLFALFKKEFENYLKKYENYLKKYRNCIISDSVRALHFTINILRIFGDIFGDILRNIDGESFREILGDLHKQHGVMDALLEKLKEKKLTIPDQDFFTSFCSIVRKAHDDLDALKQLGNNPMQKTIIESVIKDLNGIEDLNNQESRSSINLMVSLGLFSDFLTHLGDRNDWKELLEKFYSFVEKDEVLKRNVDQACLSGSVKKAFGLIGAQYKKQIESKSAEIFKITDKEKRKDELTQLLRHPQIGSYLDFLSGLKLTSEEHVNEVARILSGFCNEALSKLTNSLPESNDYCNICEELKDKFYEYSVFLTSVFNETRTLPFLGIDSKRCDSVIKVYLDYVSELKIKLKALKDDDSINAIEKGRCYFYSAANYIMKKNGHLSSEVIQMVLSEILDLHLNSSNHKKYLQHGITFYELLQYEVHGKNSSMKSLIIDGAMRFLLRELSYSKSSWHDENAFELVLNSKSLDMDLTNELIKKINECNDLRKLETIEKNVKKLLETIEKNITKLAEDSDDLKSLSRKITSLKSLSCEIMKRKSAFKVPVQERGVLFGWQKEIEQERSKSDQETPKSTNELTPSIKAASTAPANTKQSTPQLPTQTYKSHNSKSVSAFAQKVNTVNDESPKTSSSSGAPVSAKKVKQEVQAVNKAPSSQFFPPTRPQIDRSTKPATTPPQVDRSTKPKTKRTALTS